MWCVYNRVVQTLSCSVLSASRIRRIGLFKHKKNDVPVSFHSSIEISVISYIVRFLTHKYDYYSDYLELLGTGDSRHEQVHSRLGWVGVHLGRL